MRSRIRDEAYRETLLDVPLVLDRRWVDARLIEWAEATRLLEPGGPTIDLPPWHYGLRRSEAAPCANSILKETGSIGYGRCAIWGARFGVAAGRPTEQYCVRQWSLPARVGE
jgi:hypothetical protein